MKILLFTHRNDIDGMGNAILAKLAFEQVDYNLCGTFDLNKKINEYIATHKIYEYDRIYVTDLCPDESILKIVSNDQKLNNKFYVIDHHKTYDNEKYTKYQFVNVKLENNKGLCCGTSLFYQHLIDNKYIASNSTIDEFVELTRQHDTWEWKNIYNNEKARELAILFDALGIEGYIKFMYEKLQKEKTFEFNDIEKILINNKKIEIEDIIKEYLNNIYYKEILEMKAGIIFIDYQYRNEFAEYLKENKFDIDFIMMISMDRSVVSYRSIKRNISVRKVAEYFNGKGHDVAATNPIISRQKEQIINYLIDKDN